MNPIILDGPAVEPVSLAEAKGALRLDGTAEDDLVAALLVAARITVEAATRLSLVDQTWRLRLRAWPPAGHVTLPLAPVRRVVAARVSDANGVVHDLDGSDLSLDTLADPARVTRSDGSLALFPGEGGAEIDVLCGFGPAAADVPAPLRLAIERLAAFWFEHRGDDPGAASSGLPEAVRALLAPFVRPRLA